MSWEAIHFVWQDGIECRDNWSGFLVSWSRSYETDVCCFDGDGPNRVVPLHRDPVSIRVAMSLALVVLLSPMLRRQESDRFSFALIQSAIVPLSIVQ
jgi:hypothetical protein